MDQFCDVTPSRLVVGLSSDVLMMGRARLVTFMLPTLIDM